MSSEYQQRRPFQEDGKLAVDAYYEEKFIVSEPESVAINLAADELDREPFPIWTPGDNSLMPVACPVCGSIGTARYMPEHLIEAHRP